VKCITGAKVVKKIVRTIMRGGRKFSRIPFYGEKEQKIGKREEKQEKKIRAPQSDALICNK